MKLHNISETNLTKCIHYHEWQMLMGSHGWQYLTCKRSINYVLTNNDNVLRIKRIFPGTVFTWWFFKFLVTAEKNPLWSFWQLPKNKNKQAKTLTSTVPYRNIIYPINCAANLSRLFLIKMLQRSENAACRGPSGRRVASSAKQLLGQDLKTLPRHTSEF